MPRTTLDVPRLVIAGSTSGVGKTTVTVGLVAALRRRGLKVAVFKAGPDFLDPTFLQAAAERSCNNLDSWILEPNVLMTLFHRSCAGADIAVVEGMMGLYDGRGPIGDEGSTAHLSRLLKSPVVLVLDAARTSRSAAAMVLGYQRLDRRVNLSGVIANHLAGQRHAAWIGQAVQELAGVPLVGWLPRDAETVLPSRHLGLVRSSELPDRAGLVQRLGDMAERQLEIDRLLGLARSAPRIQFAPASPFGTKAPSVRVAVAMDEAFSFYYPDNLDLLWSHGAELVPFSPLHDSRLPERTDGIYLGGGYPELHAASLAQNATMKRALRAAAARGKLIYAECGGLMYLARGLRDAAGLRHRMVGLLPIDVAMQSRRTALGYASVTAQRDTPVLRKGESGRGHEFHWSRIERQPPDLDQPYLEECGGDVHPEGFSINSVFASYVHLHFASHPNIAGRLVEHWRQNRQNPVIESA